MAKMGQFIWRGLNNGATHFAFTSGDLYSSDSLSLSIGFAMIFPYEICFPRQEDITASHLISGYGKKSNLGMNDFNECAFNELEMK